MSISTHVLHLTEGRPAAGLRVVLAQHTDPVPVAEALTDADGRVADFAAHLEVGVYRLEFDTGAWFAARGESTFYPRVVITFEIAAPGEHYHVPLLLNRFGYTTYRGS